MITANIPPPPFLPFFLPSLFLSLYKNLLMNRSCMLGYLGDEGESSAHTNWNLPLHKVVALRRDDGGIHEAQEDGTVHRVQTGLRKPVHHNLH